MNDSAQRLRALDPTQSFIVQAPAGSGKTELLTQRILSLLAEAADEPEDILAITFTKKAAQEMHERVVASIALGLQPCPEQPHKQHTWRLSQRVLKQSEARGWDIINQSNRINILTIDALCAKLVRQMPLLSKMGVMPEIASDPRACYEMAAQKTIRYLLDAQDPGVMSLLLHLDNRFDKAVDMIASMLPYREQWLPVVMAHQNTDDAREALESNLERIICAQLSDAIEALSPYLHDLHTLSDYAVLHLQTPVGDALHAFHPELEAESATAPIWQALAQWVLTKDGELRKRVDKAMGFPAPSDAPSKEDKAFYKSQKEYMATCLEGIAEDELAIAALKTLNKLPSPLYGDDAWNVLFALISILPQAVAMLMLHFDESNSIDFNTVSTAALQALGETDAPTDLSLKLDHRISHILVDEFQDTSYMQFELLIRLTAGWGSGDGRTLFLVGDPMQSIYRFRQAEVSLFLRAAEQGIGALTLELLQLRMNFRSQTAVVDWINASATQFFPGRAQPELGAVPYTSSIAGQLKASQEGEGVHTHRCGSDEEEAALAVSLIQKALYEGHSSIAVLVRARSHLKYITQQLIASDIPYQAVELEPLSHKPIIQQLTILTRAYTHLADRTAWLALLRSSCCGLSLEDITVISDVNPKGCLIDNMKACLDTALISEAGHIILNRVVPLLVHALATRQRAPLSQTLRGLWVALGGVACFNQAQALDDVDQFFALLSQYEVGGTLNDLFHFHRRLEEAFSVQANVNVRVQVMTIHRSKGLEFDVVIVPGLSRRPSRSDKPLFVWDSIPIQGEEALLFAPIQALHDTPSSLYAFIADNLKKKSDHELARLLYVALTRSKSQCHLLALNKAAKGSFADLLWPDFESAERLDDDAPQCAVNELQSRSLTRLVHTWTLDRSQRDSELLAYYDTNAGNQVQLSPFSIDRVSDKCVGTVLHQALRDLATVGMDKVDALKSRWRSMLYEQLGSGCAPYFDKLMDAIHCSLADERGQWILTPHTHARCEQSIVCKDKGKSLRLIIDRSFIDEHGNVWVIDYKSTLFEQGDLQAFYAQAKRDHVEQLNAYARALSQMHNSDVHCGIYFPRMSGWVEWDYKKIEGEQGYG